MRDRCPGVDLTAAFRFALQHAVFDPFSIEAERFAFLRIERGLQTALLTERRLVLVLHGFDNSAQLAVQLSLILGVLKGFGLPALMFIALVAGASERLVPTIIKKTEDDAAAPGKGNTPT